MSKSERRRERCSCCCTVLCDVPSTALYLEGENSLPLLGAFSLSAAADAMIAYSVHTTKCERTGEGRGGGVCDDDNGMLNERANTRSYTIAIVDVCCA